MNITVLFSGILAEVTRTPVKNYLNVTSFSDLTFRIADDFPELIRYSYRISVNQKITDSMPELREGDTVALLPPLTGR